PPAGDATVATAHTTNPALQTATVTIAGSGRSRRAVSAATRTTGRIAATGRTTRRSWPPNTGPKPAPPRSASAATGGSAVSRGRDPRAGPAGSVTRTDGPLGGC